jgi:hypothetical protein
MSSRSNPFLLGVLVVLTVGAAPARADKCNGAKVRAIGKKEAGLLGCVAKEATQNASIEPACDQGVSGKFMPTYDRPTGCSPAAPSDTTCENAADTCQSTIRGLLPDGNGTTPSKCEAARLKAAGKLASDELGCYSKAAAKGVPVQPGCISKATGKFTLAFNKVSACTGDGTASGVQTDVENDCINNMVDISGGTFVAITCGGTATTTTTTTTSTITTPFPPCPPGAYPGYPCGSCGSGFCFPLCQDTCPGSGLACVADIGSTSQVCTTDTQCPVGLLCGAGVCGTCGLGGGGLNGCLPPCP